MPTVRLPGAADVHVHLREPGDTHKEDFASGTAAALAGGVVTVLAMPNTRPPLADPATFQEAAQRARARARCEVGLFVGGTAENAEAAAALASQAAGLKLYLDATYGPLRLEALPAILRHFQTWPGHRPIAVHAEGRTVAMVLGLVALFRKPVHFCHISRREEILLIRRAKERGLPVTCEVTPHHLFLTEDDLPRLGPFGEMRPPLATRADQATLWANLAVIDAVATDHAPHTVEEKQGPNPPPGVPGLETMLPLLLTAAAEGRLPLEEAVRLTATGPRRIYSLLEPPETWVEVEWGGPWIISREGLFTRCGWTPFEGMAVRARVRRTVLWGQVAFEDGKVLAPPGSGRVLFVEP
ncbi:amidohydrolase family protein [Thermoflexus sp.]|uniref:amidohydrolase family protein n=1 Tax=Thermoflexus sp. TaxID=1969742 RepID=UPI0035E40599